GSSDGGPLRETISVAELRSRKSQQPWLRMRRRNRKVFRPDKRCYCEPGSISNRYYWRDLSSPVQLRARPSLRIRHTHCDAGDSCSTAVLPGAHRDSIVRQQLSLVYSRGKRLSERH